MTPAKLLSCSCDACGHRWTAAELGDCPHCGGTARLRCFHPRLSGRTGDISRTCLACGSMLVRAVGP
jgi:hypothetical protein